MPDFPLRVSDDAALPELERVLDRDRKIPSTLEVLGPLAARRVVLIRPEPVFASDLIDRLGPFVDVARQLPAPELPDASADVVVTWFSAIAPGVDPTEAVEAQIADAQRILVPGGRLLVVHDYGRDDITPLETDATAETLRVEWSRPKGWFLSRDFKVRVIHAWLDFETVDQAADLLGRAFARDPGVLVAGFRRPRIAWKVAVYHRTMGVPG